MTLRQLRKFSKEYNHNFTIPIRGGLKQYVSRARYMVLLLPYRPRFLNRFYAFLNGFFWIPCPLCNKKFGGHEWIGTVYDKEYRGNGICPKCSLNNYNKTGKTDITYEEYLKYIEIENRDKAISKILN